MKTITYNEQGWVCDRYPYDIPITDSCKTIEVEDSEYNESFYTRQYYAWRIVDGKLVNELYEVKKWTAEERLEERRHLHKATDEDYAKFSRQVRMNVDTEHSQACLDYIDQYNLEVSNTVNQPNFPQEVTYPEYSIDKV